MYPEIRVPESWERFLAKPKAFPRISLREHTGRVLQEAQAILKSHPTLVDKYRRLTGGDLRELLTQAALYHDLGKSAAPWAKACEADRELDLQGRSLTHLKNLGFRHEIASFCLLKGLAAENSTAPKLDPVSKVAILAHHGKARRGSEATHWVGRPPDYDFSEALRWLKAFKGLSSAPAHRKEGLIKKLKYSGPRALLQIADQAASAKESGNPVPEWSPFRFEFPPNYVKNAVQTAIEAAYDQPLSLLKAPTGSGKTLAAFLWAEAQVRQRRADRMVIAMPTRFTSKALAVSQPEQLQVGLYHSTSLFVLREKLARTSADALRGEAEARAFNHQAKIFGCPVTVTTIDQVLLSLTTTTEDGHKTFFSLANSCLVVDEADFYDNFTLESLKVCLQLLHLLEVPVLLMSATLPDCAPELYALEPTQMPPLIVPKDPDKDVPKYHLTVVQEPVDRPEAIDPLIGSARDEPVILFANTVSRAIGYYRRARAILPDLGDRILLHHSRFTEPHKEQKEKRIIDLLGEKAWKGGAPAGALVILTQIGELSLNISCTRMISEVCPIDRLGQRLGRLERFRKRQVGEAILVVPAKGGKVSHLPYPTGDGKRKTPFDLSLELALRLNQITFSRSDLEMMVNQVYTLEAYQTLQAEDKEGRRNKEYYLQDILQNFIFLPEFKPQDGIEESSNWRARNIRGNFEVYLRDRLPLERSFRNRLAFDDFCLNHGISIPAWDQASLFKAGLLKSATVTVNEEEEPIWVLDPVAYDPEIGVSIPPIGL